MQRHHSFTLTEISEWAQNNHVALPTVQRGFVWKPSQVENLWDSLLRGYPVGSFVLSSGGGTGDGQGAPLDLLDGQQRATAICLGFGNAAFRQSADSAKVFIDLESPTGDDNRKYIFRAITRSHPWGYQATDNSKPLEADNIRKAMELYGVRDHLDENCLEKFFPFDAVFPLPLELLLRPAVAGAGGAELIRCLEQWQLWDSVVSCWEGKVAGQAGGRKVFELTSMELVREKILSIYDEVVKMLHDTEGRRVPALYLDFKAILSEGARRHVEQAAPAVGASDDAANEPKDDEIETLFVRLNAGGTPLRGEELNYSILKANINSALQDEIENACTGLFAPARFITIAYRLFQLCRGAGARDAISMKIKPKQFQKTMTDDVDGFSSFLVRLVEGKEFEGRNLLQYTRDLLVYHERLNPQGLPFLVASKLSSSAPEIMFMLLYRLMKMGDRFSPTDGAELHRRMLGMITLFAWLGRGEKLRDHAKLLSNIWPAASLEAEQFWSSATVQRAKLEGVLPEMPTLAQLEKVPGAVRQSNSDIWSRFENACGATSFLWRRIFNNRDLILYAQRQALLEWFEERLYGMEDTNVPFDWDHIFPNKFVKSKRNIPRMLRDSYNTNGNFRAWPYPLNRGDHDVLPWVKLNPTPENTVDYPEMVNSWKHYFDRRPRIQADVKHLPAQLLRWSRCDPKWTSPGITNVRTQFRQVYGLIMERNVELCREWYRELRIGSLMPTETEFCCFDAFINKTRWGAMPKRFADRFEDVDEYQFRVCTPLQVGASKLYLYLCYPGSGPDGVAENLKEDAVSFGVIDENIDGILSRVRARAEVEKSYQVFDGVIENSFTLISCQEQHYLQLFAQFHAWLAQFPRKEVQVLADHFLSSLITRYRERARCCRL